MAKVKLPRGIRENKGTYEARAMVNGVKICLYSSDLDQLKEEFEQAKQQARNNLDYKRTQMTLNEWFEEWFTDVKTHKVKETSISPMRNNFKRTFGFYIGTMKGEPSVKCMVKQLKEIDSYQKVVLYPFMTAAGSHVYQDIAGDGTSSWKYVLEQAGYEVSCIYEGLGQLKEVQNIFAAHIKAVLP